MLPFQEAPFAESTKMHALLIMHELSHKNNSSKHNKQKAFLFTNNVGIVLNMHIFSGVLRTKMLYLRNIVLCTRIR